MASKNSLTKAHKPLENLKRFISRIREQSALIQTEDGLLKFAPDDSEMLFESVSNIEGDHKKERLRVAIRDIFDLDSKDIVIFRQNDIFIKRWGSAPLIHPQLIEKIKEAKPQTTVFLISAHNTPDNTKAAKELGAARFFPKPLNLDTFEAAVREALTCQQ